MVSVEITKPTAAQRQIDAAIRMLFSVEDALAVHTVVAAAHRIVLDLMEKRGQDLYAEPLREGVVGLYQEQLGISPPDEIIQRILPEAGKFFRKHLNRPANFLKHANVDAEGFLPQDSLRTDHLLLASCAGYKQLGLALTSEMEAFGRWHLAVYPHEDTDPICTGVGYIHDLSRSEQLEFGRALLGLYREQGGTGS